MSTSKTLRSMNSPNPKKPWAYYAQHVDPATMVARATIAKFRAGQIEKTDSSLAEHRRCSDPRK